MLVVVTFGVNSSAALHLPGNPFTNGLKSTGLANVGKMLPKKRVYNVTSRGVVMMSDHHRQPSLPPYYCGNIKTIDMKIVFSQKR